MKTQRIFKSDAGRQLILNTYDEILRVWPVPCQTQRIPTRHGETHVLTCGDPAAPALVLLHGSASNSAMWLGDSSAYAAHYRIVAVDLPGEPGHSEAVRFDLNGPAGAEWLEDVLSALGVGRFSLVGISLGGWLALKMATTHPERVDKMALLCPTEVAPTNNRFLLKIVFLSLLGPWGVKRVMTLFNGGQPLDPDTMRYSRVINHNFNPRMEPFPIFRDEELGRLSMPVLLLAGDKDPIVDIPATIARLRKLLPCLAVQLLPAEGHVLANQAGRVLPFLRPAIMTGEE